MAKGDFGSSSTSGTTQGNVLNLAGLMARMRASQGGGMMGPGQFAGGMLPNFGGGSTQGKSGMGQNFQYDGNANKPISNMGNASVPGLPYLPTPATSISNPGLFTQIAGNPFNQGGGYSNPFNTPRFNYQMGQPNYDLASGERKMLQENLMNRNTGINGGGDVNQTRNFIPYSS